MNEDPLVDLALRHVAILGFVALAAWLLVIRRRARSLVAAGTVTARDLDGFIARAMVVVAFGAAVLWTLQARVPDPACLLVFPPPATEGRVAWAAFALAAVLVCVWTWRRGGADLLRRISPAMWSRGDTLSHLSVRGLRWRITAVLLGLPLFIVALQRLLPHWLAHC
jgi:hypothetical protein